MSSPNSFLVSSLCCLVLLTIYLPHTSIYLFILYQFISILPLCGWLVSFPFSASLFSIIYLHHFYLKFPVLAAALDILLTGEGLLFIWYSLLKTLYFLLFYHPCSICLYINDLSIFPNWYLLLFFLQPNTVPFIYLLSFFFHYRYLSSLQLLTSLHYFNALSFNIYFLVFYQISCVLFVSFQLPT